MLSRAKNHTYINHAPTYVHSKHTPNQIYPYMSHPIGVILTFHMAQYKRK